jgi:hypothetical protein
LFLVSLIPAAAGAGMAYVMVMSFLNFADRSSGALKGVAGLALLLGAALAVTPIGILVFGGPKKEKKPKAEPDVTGDTGTDETVIVEDEALEEDAFEEGADDDVDTAALDDDLEATAAFEEVNEDDDTFAIEQDVDADSDDLASVAEDSDDEFAFEAEEESDDVFSFDDELSDDEDDSSTGGKKKK